MKAPWSRGSTVNPVGKKVKSPHCAGFFVCEHCLAGVVKNRRNKIAVYGVFILYHDVIVWLSGNCEALRRLFFFQACTIKAAGTSLFDIFFKGCVLPGMLDFRLAAGFQNVLTFFHAFFKCAFLEWYLVFAEQHLH